MQSAEILSRPDQQIRMFFPKKIFGVVSQILTIIRGVHGGGKTLCFSPPTNHNRDFVPVYARRLGTKGDAGADLTWPEHTSTKMEGGLDRKLHFPLLIRFNLDSTKRPFPRPHYVLDFAILIS